MTASTKERRTGDFLLYDIPQVSREAIILVNDTTTTITRTAEQLIGYPIQATTTANTFRLCIVGEESLASGFIISGPALNFTSGALVSYDHVAVTLPPVTINKNKFATLDFLGSTFTVASLAARALALMMRCVVEPTKTTTQSQ